jgi:hypothetical protein
LKWRKWLEWQKWDLILKEASKFHPLPADLSLIALEAYLFKDDLKKAQKEFEHYSLEELSNHDSLLPFLYGCYLLTTENKEIASAHFGGIMESTYPRSWNLGRAAIREKLSTRWFATAFLWEKRELARQMALYFFCLGEEEKSRESLSRLRELIPVE